MRKEIQERILAIMEAAVRDEITAGVSLLVRRNGEELFYGACGYADRENRVPVRRNTIFRLYSMTKPVTAVASMILMERGILDPAQPVADFLPGFRNLKVETEKGIVPVSREMTVFHLLNMTSGLTYGSEMTASDRSVLGHIADCMERMYGQDPVSTMEFANGLGRIPLAFSPDSSWCYGLSADVLGAVVEQASGMRFGEFLEKNIFEPLGMKDTGFWVPPEKQERLAKSYEAVEDGMIPYTGDYLAVSNAMKEPPAYEAGGAGLVSTIDDYGKFAQMLLNGGILDGKRILSEETVKYMTTGRLTADQQKALRDWSSLEGFTYSHLLRIMNHPEQAAGLARMGEYGWDGWLGCYFANFPQEQMSILLMQQKKDAGTISMTRKIRNVILSSGEV